MSAIPTTTMRITEAFRDELNSKGKRGETLEEIIKRLLNEKHIETQKIEPKIESNYAYNPKNEFAEKYKDLILTPWEKKDMDERFDEYYDIQMADYITKRNTKVDVNKVNAKIKESYSERVPETIFEDEEERDSYGYHG